MRPFSAERRVYVIWSADAMPELVQHALLKSIEEPPPYVVVILVTSLPHMLLPTVRSRCQVVPFARLTSEEIEGALVEDGVGAEAAHAAARASGGSLDRARDLAAGGAAAKRRALYLDTARAVYHDPEFDPGAAAARIDRAAARRGADEAARVEAEGAAALEQLGASAPARERARVKKAGEDLAKRRRRAAHVDETREAVETIAGWYRDLLAVSLGATSAVVHSDRRTALEEDAATGAGAAAGQALDIARDVRRQLNLTLTPALAVEGLLHRIWLVADARRLSRT
jgi:DNA polymerase-3 subunit delta'